MELGQHVNCIQEKVKLFFWRIAKGTRKSIFMINGMARTLCLSYRSLVPKVRWIIAISSCLWSCQDYASDSPKREGCNQIDISHLKDQFFLELFNLSIKECMDYEKDINSCKGVVSFMKLFTNIVTHFVAVI